MEFKNFQGPNFITQIPTDWFISSSPDFQAIFLAPPEADDTRANLTVSIRRLSEPTTIPEFVQQVELERQKDYADYTPIEEVDYTASGGSGYQSIFRWYNEARETYVYQLQALYLVNDVLFTLTGSTIEAHQATYLPIFQQINDAFRISA